MKIDVSLGGRLYEETRGVERVSFQGVHRACPNCGKMKPIDQFGVRVVNGTLRVQSRCGECR